MSANPIIQTFEICKDRSSGFEPRCKTGAIHTLAFQGAEKALHRCMVVALPDAAHAHHDPSLGQLALIA